MIDQCSIRTDRTQLSEKQWKSILEEDTANFFQTSQALLFFEKTGIKTFSFIALAGEDDLGIVSGIILKENGIDPIINLSCRNRNRISLTSELLGCASLDMKNLLLTRGEKIPKEVEPRPKAIMDMNADALISLANKIKMDEKLPTNNDFLIGGVVTPFAPKPGWPAKNLTEKVEAGAQFVITHTCLDMEIMKIYMERLIATKLLRKMHLIAGVAILKSADDAKWLRENRPNVIIPAEAVSRLEKSKDPEKEGIKMCAEQLIALSKIPGVSGAHIIASNSVLNIPEAIALFRA